jgi:hypothetical protein
MVGENKRRYYSRDVQTLYIYYSMYVTVTAIQRDAATDA